MLNGIADGDGRIGAGSRSGGGSVGGRGAVTLAIRAVQSREVAGMAKSCFDGGLGEECDA